MSTDIKQRSSSQINDILLICFKSTSSNTLRLMPWPGTSFIWSYSTFLSQSHQIPDCPFHLVPDVIVPAEDHSSFAEAGAADLSQLSLAAGALKAARVPIPIHGEEQEAIRDPTSASCTGAHCPTTTSCYRHGGGFHTAVHHRLPAGQSGEARKSAYLACVIQKPDSSTSIRRSAIRDVSTNLFKQITIIHSFLWS